MARCMTSRIRAKRLLVSFKWDTTPSACCRSRAFWSFSFSSCLFLGCRWLFALSTDHQQQQPKVPNPFSCSRSFLLPLMERQEPPACNKTSWKKSLDKRNAPHMDVAIYFQSHKSIASTWDECWICLFSGICWPVAPRWGKTQFMPTVKWPSFTGPLKLILFIFC